jgi:hypothetical protein
LLGLLLLGICGVFSIWVVGRHETNLAATEAAQRASRDPTGNGQPELLQGQRDKLKIARTLQLGSGVAGVVLMLGGIALLRRRKLA